MTPTELATHIRRLNARELATLLRLLRDLPGFGPTGVREPRRPIQPLDARGLALDAKTGKTDDRR